MTRPLLRVLLSAVLIQCGVLSGIANADQWQAGAQVPAQGQLGIGLAEEVYAPSYSFFSNATSEANGQAQVTDCSTLTTSNVCAGTELSSTTTSTNNSTTVTSNDTGALIELPACASATQTNCVASLSLGTSAASMVASTLTGSAPGPTFSANSKLNLPAGATASLWTNPTLNAGGTDTYAVVADMSMYYNSFSGTFEFPSANDGFFPLQIKVVPYTTESRPGVMAPTLESVPQPGGFSDNIFETFATQGCAWTGSGECGASQDFSPGTYVGVSVRVSNQLGGWYEARMQDTQIAVSTFDTTSDVINVSGESVIVPQLQVFGSSSNTALEQAWPGGSPPSTGIAITNSAGSFGIEEVDTLRTLANNTATATINVWNFSTANSTGNSCLTDTSKVLGIVSTNAMATDGSAPTFANGFLTYNVAGMHYLPDGSLALGTYDLDLADSVAQCLYGFSNAPISATISVSENNGVENISSTSVTDQGGWLHLAAYGFTFSNPIISVKLTQPSNSKKVVTLRCVRGTVKRKVTGISPKCPAGFKIA